jgi:hypothetical protein
MMSTKIYIAGRVTGIPRAEAAHKFERGKKLLMQNGFNYINPMDMVPEDATPKEAMRLCLPFLLSETCDGILLLDGHEFSEGALIEKQLARYCGLQLFNEDDLV